MDIKLISQNRICKENRNNTKVEKIVKKKKNCNAHPY